MESSGAEISSDEELVARLAAGEQAALVEIVRRHQARALRIAFHTVGQRALAEDIAQEAFLRVWRGAGRFQARASFKSWFYRIIVNLCLDAKRQRTPESREQLEAPDCSQAEPPHALVDLERQSLVRRAVAELPERQRVALVLHRYSDLSLLEIGHATGWTESAVESLLVRAYAALRKQLADFAAEYPQSTAGKRQDRTSKEG
jgi:RNA polymerase sigma-70 factor (ECF subfamily)